MKQNIIVVLGVVLLTTNAVSAELVPSGSYAGTPTGTSSGELLWSQLDEPSGSAFTDQAFEANYAAYDSWGADDFVVSGGYGWWVTELFTPGSVTDAGVNPFFVNVAFYEDAGGLPGRVICDFPSNTNFSSAGDGDITTEVACELLSFDDSERAYWFSQQVRLDFLPYGQHYWATRISANENPGVWKNPGNGFGIGCFDWQSANAVCGMTGEDWLFELSTTPCCDEGAIPAIGPFGVVLLIVSLGAGSAYVLRRRR